MLIAARNGFAVDGGLSAKSYIQDGLVAMWDVKAIPPSATVWDAIVGSGISWALTGTSVDVDGGLQFAGTRNSYGELTPAQSAKVWSADGTLEVVARLLALPADNGGRGGVILKSQDGSLVGLGLFGSTSSDVAGANVTAKPIAIYRSGESWNRLVGAFLQISITYVQGNVAYYFSGINTLTLSSNSIGGSQGFTTLGSRASGTHPFHGNIYSVRYYSRALTAEEIAANYAVDKARFNLP